MPECLIVTAVQQELGALSGAGGIVGSVETLDIGPYSCRLFRTGNAAILALAGGIGPAAAASATASILALRPGIELVLSAGIGGGFEAAAVNIGDVVLATSIHFADLGAHSPEKFLDAHALGWGHANVTCPEHRVQKLASALTAAGLRTHRGPIVTVAAATGTDERAHELFQRHGALCEAMEGAGVAVAAANYKVPVLELRAISNRAGRRNMNAWDIPLALKTLARACGVFAETVS